MLSKTYLEVKRLRSTGACTQAIELLATSRPSSDEDALEAAVCLLVCGQAENAVHVVRTYVWTKAPMRSIAGAFADLLSGVDDQRTLSVARAGADDPAVPADGAAIYLLLLQKHQLFEEAGAYIVRRWSDPPAAETFLLTMIAELAAASGNWRQAYRAAAGVLAMDPDDYRALVAISIASFRDGNFHEALGTARRANALNPGAAPAILQIMRCQNKLSDHYAVLAAFDKLEDKSEIATDLHIELAKGYTGLHRPHLAIESYRAALATDPASVEAVRELAAVYTMACDADGMASLVADYDSVMRTDVEAMYWRGLEALNRGEVDIAWSLFRDSLGVSEASGDAHGLIPWPIPEPRLRHDYEQLDLLARRGKLTSAGRTALKILSPYYQRSGDTRMKFSPEGTTGETLQTVLATRYYVPETKPIEGVLGANDYSAIEDKYLAERLVVIDNFLSPDGLAALREFSEEATVWKSYHHHGYVGAIIALGFAPHVLLTLSDELRRAMPRVVANHPLLQAWGFKYDQRLQGINMHADFAKVNVNFWITPDEACLDAESGGMVVYDLPVPRSWSFADYNIDPGRLASYVKLQGATPLRVPYRANRCVLFDSSLIHVTDRMVFKPGYENRRVNVTLLYGQGLSLD